MKLSELVEQLNAAAPADPRMKQPLPPIAHLVTPLVRAFPSADVEEQQAARKALSRNAAVVLLRYAWECASEAVRKQAPEIVWDGLVALSLEDGRMDPRISIIWPLAVLYDSTEMLGIDAHPMFEAAAALTTNMILKKSIRYFPSRTPERRDLRKGFDIIKRMTAEGFMYDWLPVTRREMWWQRLTDWLGRARLSGGKTG